MGRVYLSVCGPGAELVRASDASFAREFRPRVSPTSFAHEWPVGRISRAYAPQARVSPAYNLEHDLATSARRIRREPVLARMPMHIRILRKCCDIASLALSP